MGQDQPTTLVIHLTPDMLNQQAQDDPVSETPDDDLRMECIRDSRRILKRAEDNVASLQSGQQRSDALLHIADRYAALFQIISGPPEP